MLKNIIGFSVRNKLIIGLLTLGLILYGSYELTRLPIDAVPDITNNQVQVITVAPSLGATDIERLVTFPVEQENANIPGLVEIRSFSRFGLSLVTIVFEDDIDIYWARQQVSERLQNVRSRIPEGVGSPELGPVTTGLGEIYQYVVRPAPGYENSYNTTDLRTIQDWVVRRQLLGVSGVADVSSFGGHLMQYEIAVDPDRLNAMHVTLDEVFAAVQRNNANTGGAYIEKGPAVLYIRTEGLASSLHDLAAIPVKSGENGTAVLLKDVAEIGTGTAVRYGAMHYNDKGEVSGAVVMMLKGENSSKVITAVKEKIEAIRKTLPEGIILEPFLDRSKMVNNAIGTVEKNLMEGALIVVFVLVLFLGNLRAGLLVASVIPLSMLFAVIMMNLFGVSGNLMSLGALDFGLIVDGAVIIVEAVMHSMTASAAGSALLRLDRKSMDEEVRNSASRMMNSAVFGQIIILIVYLPIFTLQGIEGKMFRPMAQTVIFALAGAFILSLTYIPMMSSFFLSRKIHVKKNLSDRMMDSLGNIYRKMLERTLRKPALIMGSILVLLVVSVFVLGRLGGEFIPALEEGDFALETRVLPGSNLDVSIRAAKQASSILLEKFPEVKKVVSKIGSGEVPTDPMPIDAQDLMIILKDKKEWTSAESFGELAEKMGDALKDVPGVSFGFQYPVQMRFNELMTGAKQDVVCKIFGDDLDSLVKHAERLGSLAGKIEGAEDIYVEPVAGIPQVLIKYRRDMLSRYGLDIESINRAVNMSFAGAPAGNVFDGEKRFELVIRLKKEKRTDVSHIRNLLVPDGKGGYLPLHYLADVDIVYSPNQIQREGARRRIVVGFNVRNRDVQSVVNDLQKAVGQQMRLPYGYYMTYGGSFENLNRAKARLAVAVPVALLLIWLMLYFAFSNVAQTLLIYTTIPLSAIGGIFALYTRGMPFSISAGIGFIALFGVAVLNGIVLISEFNRLRASGMQDTREIVLTGTGLRLRPVLMTAMVASLGFLPMALSNGAGAEVQRPLASVVIGGLLIATFLTLFVLPALYILTDKGFKTMNTKNITLAIALLLAIPASEAQQVIGLRQATDSALANNLMVRNERLNLEYGKAMIRSSEDLALTGFSFEHGQINSRFTDNRFTVSQQLKYPAFYIRQRQLNLEKAESARCRLELSEHELRRQVAYVYFRILYMDEKIRILRQSDTMYAARESMAEARFRTGADDHFERISAGLQRQQIALQLSSAERERYLLLLEFNWLLNSTTEQTPESRLSRLPLRLPDTTALASHPQLELLRQDIIISENRQKLERSKQMPGLQLSYADMSMRGTGADNISYGPSARFRSLQLGVGIPLFSGAQKAAVRASGVEIDLAAGRLEQKEEELKIQMTRTAARVKYAAEMLNWYDSTGFSEIELLRTTAGLKLSSGEISYPEWVLMHNQVAEARHRYNDLLMEYNEAVIELHYLLGNTNY